jgi:hypothetical protein
MISLWDLMTLLSGGAAFGGALAAAKVAGNDRVAIVIAVVLGSLVAVACIALVRVLGRRMITRLYPGLSDQGNHSQRGVSALRLIYTATFVWIVVSGVIGMQIVAIAIRIAAR